MDNFEEQLRKLEKWAEKMDKTMSDFDDANKLVGELMTVLISQIKINDGTILYVVGRFSAVIVAAMEKTAKNGEALSILYKGMFEQMLKLARKDIDNILKEI